MNNNNKKHTTQQRQKFHGIAYKTGDTAFYLMLLYIQMLASLTTQEVLKPKGFD